MDQGFPIAFLLLLYIPAGIPWVFGCNKPGPEDCDFEYYDRSERTYKHTFCSWESDGGFNTYRFPNKPRDIFVGLDNDKDFAHLTSKEACSTGGETYCLRFKYQILVEDTDLSVSIKYEGTEEAEPPIWTMSSSIGWDGARVPITTHNDFKVVFKARRRSAEPTDLEPVFFDDIKFEKKACSLFPRDATPPPSTTTPTTLPSTTTTSTPVPSTTTTAPPTTYSTRGTRVVEAATSEASTSITTVKTTKASNNLTETQSGHQGSNSAEQSKKVGLIVGVIVAVVVVAILLLLLVFLRHRLLESCKRRFKSEQQKHCEDNTEHNFTYGHSPEDSHYANAAGLKHVDSSPKHRIEPRTSAETSDYYSVVSSQDEMQLPSESEAAQYAVVNKPGKGTQSGSSKSRGKSSTSTDATTDESHYYSTATEAEYNNIPFQAGRQNGDVSSPASTKITTDTSNTSRYHVLEKQRAEKDGSVYYGQKEDKATVQGSQRDVYNSLDFDGKGVNTRKYGDALGTVYSHLNEGVEGTYNEVDRQKRAEVIDSDYSHIP